MTLTNILGVSLVIIPKKTLKNLNVAHFSVYLQFYDYSFKIKW